MIHSFWCITKGYDRNHSTAKNGKTLNDLGLANTPLSFSSAWITGKDYGKVIPNKLVRESDNSWFIASGNEMKDCIG